MRTTHSPSYLIKNHYSYCFRMVGHFWGKAFLQMLGVFAEFETNPRKERQMAGIAKAKAKGKYKGRKPSLTYSQKKDITAKKTQGINPSQLSKEFGVSRATIYNRAEKSNMNIYSDKHIICF